MNAYDIVISLLGDSGKKLWLRTEILETLAEKLKIEKTEANNRFIATISRTDYFEKISDTPAKYQFTKSGEDRYKTIKKQENYEVRFRTDIDEFIRIYYWDEFTECVNHHIEYLDIDYNKLAQGLPFIAEGLLEDKPDKLLDEFNNALHKISVPIDDDFRPFISVYNFGDVLQVEGVKTQHIGKFVEVEGRVVVQTMPKSKIMRAAFECMRCTHITYVQQEDRKFIEPFECDNNVCGRKGPFKLLDPPESQFIDGQEIIVESLRGGQMVIYASVSGSLCRPPWERDAKVVRICGIVRKLQCSTKMGKSPNFDWCVDVNSIKFSDDSNTEPPTEEEIEMFDEWAQNPTELRKKILESIAPDIDGLFDIKDACSLTLFSDWNWMADPRDVIERSSIHVLLFGDPGVAKSQIIKDVIYLAPKGKFGQVTNMTRGGLSTAAVQENGEWHVKSGFFSQGDQGVVGLDEIDKVHDPKDLNCLVSVLNDQIQLVSKIGKNDIPFNTRTAVIGAANPKKGGYLDKNEIMSQIEETIPAYIFQRFDIIFAIRDIPEKEKDAVIADIINSMHSNSKMNRKNMPRTIQPELFRKYVIYARSKPVPEFEENAQKQIKEYYLQLRAIPGEYPVIGARQVNNINRISRAIARREMALKVTEDHVKYAIGIMKASLSTISDEHEYGVYNFGRTKSQAEKIKTIRDAIKEICRADNSAKIEEIIFTTGLDAVQVEHTLILMERTKEVFKIKGGYRTT